MKYNQKNILSIKIESQNQEICVNQPGNGEFFYIFKNVNDSKTEYINTDLSLDVVMASPETPEYLVKGQYWEYLGYDTRTDIFGREHENYINKIIERGEYV
jgi:hypothetical protein